MSDEVRINFIWGCVIASVLNSLIWALCHYNLNYDKNLAEAGLIQKNEPWSYRVIWTKP